MNITINLKEEPIDFTKNQILIHKKDGFQVNIVTNVKIEDPNLFNGFDMFNGKYLPNLFKSDFRAKEPNFKKIDWNNLGQYLYYEENNKFLIVRLVSKSRGDYEKETFFCEVVINQVNDFTGIQCFEKKEFNLFEGTISINQ